MLKAGAKVLSICTKQALSKPTGGGGGGSRAAMRGTIVLAPGAVAVGALARGPPAAAAAAAAAKGSMGKVRVRLTWFGLLGARETQESLTRYLNIQQRQQLVAPPPRSASMTAEEADRLMKTKSKHAAEARLVRERCERSRSRCRSAHHAIDRSIYRRSCRTSWTPCSTRWRRRRSGRSTPRRCRPSTSTPTIARR